MDHTADQRAFARLLTIMDELREQCPWDKEQTLESLRHLTIEEMYELSEAILAQDMDGLQGELGDLLLHIVFYSKIATEKGAFTVADMINRLCEKLIRRHPHIYGNIEADNAETVKQNWELIKLKEGTQSVLKGVPQGLPALVKAYRIQEKVGSVGFEWKERDGVLDKVQEEIRELEQAVQENMSIQKREEELGDLLFSIVNYARYIGVNPEDALERTNRKFISRFQYIETQARAQGSALQNMTLTEMDQLWDEAKKVLAEK
jgi:XTP/dITP diphosphohydrolase